jgi:hypothetical protein
MNVEPVDALVDSVTGHQLQSQDKGGHGNPSVPS